VFQLIILCLIYAVIAVCGVILIKFELPGHRLITLQDYVKLILTWRVILGFIIIGISSLVQMKILSIWKMSQAIPISTAIYFIFLGIFGFFLFNEKISLFTIIGIILVMAGIAFISIKTA
jgi:small multidrug resistance pump